MSGVTIKRCRFINKGNVTYSDDWTEEEAAADRLSIDRHMDRSRPETPITNQSQMGAQ